MTEHTDFLLARIAEDESAAKTCPWEPVWEADSDPHEPRTRPSGQTIATHIPYKEWAAHIARWDPARVLAECEARRRIIEAYREAVWAHSTDDAELNAALSGREQALEDVVRLFTLPYADQRTAGRSGDRDARRYSRGSSGVYLGCGRTVPAPRVRSGRPAADWRGGGRTVYRLWSPASRFVVRHAAC